MQKKGLHNTMGTETKKITDLFNTAENCTNVVQM